MNAVDEIDQGIRFSFGKNWASFLQALDESRIEIATQSLRDILQVENLQGKTFLDVGCGSGLFSLAARRLGARVHSFDFDPDSVRCARQLHSRFDAGNPDWVIEQGSVLDDVFLKKLGEHDVVYSWGVLHHTGKMWTALENAANLVRPDGKLAIAIYNDQGWRSRAWLKVKQLYCANSLGRIAVQLVFLPWFFVRAVLVSLVRGRNEFAAYRRNRGMSIVHDWIDWLGGLPFEVATFNEIVRFFSDRNFRLLTSKRTRRLGCNEFCFEKE